MAEASSNPSGRPRMTRSEAARHAALVRYGKEHALGPATGGMSNPKIRARVAEILAEKANKGKKKAKGAGGKGKAKAAKPKQTKEQKDQAKQQEAAQNREKALGQLKNKPNAASMAALDALSKGEAPDKDQADALADETGLVEKHSDGSHTLSAAGHKLLSSLSKGDVAGAQEAMSRGADASDKKASAASKKQEREKATADRKQASEAKKAERAKQVAEKQKAAEKKRGQLKKAAAKEKAKKEQERQAKQDQADADTKQAVMGALEKWRKVREIQKAGKSMDIAIKAGARHSSADMKHLQAIHDSSVACGASCATESDDSPETDTQIGDEASKAIKAMYDDPVAYASHECSDIQSACASLSNLCFILQSELGEDNEDEDTVPGLVKAARLLIAFIENELDEVENYDAEPDEGAGETVGHEPMKAITAREDVNPKAGIAEYGKVDFADAKNKKYPIDTEAHVRSAWNYIAKEENAAKYDPDEVKQIKAKIVAAWKKLIDDAGPPAAGKALDLIHVAGGAIKALDSDTIGGYAVLFGSADAPDIERDYYTKSTDFWLDHFGWPRPITYHHGMDAATKAAPVIGHWTKATIDDTGVWLEGQLDRAHAYYAAIKQLAERGYLKLSSDSAPQWVVRERQPNGANHVKRWPLVTASTTVTPMEPRMLPVEVKAFLAELGLEGIDDSQEATNPDAAQDAAKAADDERARVLLLELDLLQLEWETASV